MFDLAAQTADIFGYHFRSIVIVFVLESGAFFLSGHGNSVSRITILLNLELLDGNGGRSDFRFASCILLLHTSARHNFCSRVLARSLNFFLRPLSTAATPLQICAGASVYKSAHYESAIAGLCARGSVHLRHTNRQTGYGVRSLAKRPNWRGNGTHRVHLNAFDVDTMIALPMDFHLSIGSANSRLAPFPDFHSDPDGTASSQFEGHKSTLASICDTHS